MDTDDNDLVMLELSEAQARELSNWLADALRWISHIARTNYEQDTKLRANSARTLKRIADRADEALEQATKGEKVMNTKAQQRAELAQLLAATTVPVTKCAPMVRENYRMARLPGSGPVPAYVYDDGVHHGNRAVAIIH